MSEPNDPKYTRIRSMIKAEIDKYMFFNSPTELRVRYYPAFTILADSLVLGSTQINWYPDVNLYRNSADELKTDDNLTLPLNLNIIGASSKILFGSLADTNLYRSAADTLKTDDSLLVASNITLNGNLYFGADVDLYRSAADVLKTDDALKIGTQILSEHLSVGMLASSASFSAAGDVITFSPPRNGTLKGFQITYYLGATNNGSNYWTIYLKDAIGNTYDTHSTSAESASGYKYYVNTSLNSSITASSILFFLINLAKTGSPTNISIQGINYWLE